MKTIKFMNFEYFENGFECSVLRCNEQNILDINKLFFKANINFVPNSDVLAVILAILCRKNFDHIYFDLEISNFINDVIKRYIVGEFNTKKVYYSSMPIYNLSNRVSLNFSGGLDSFAASCLLPEYMDLVSLDFGGDFSREFNFFKKFNTLILSSNFVLLKLGGDAVDSNFMTIASIYFNHILHNKFFCYGTILEAFNKINPKFNYDNLYLLNSINLKRLRFTEGLTEIGTCKVVANYYPGLVEESLFSLSTEGSEKYSRKFFIIKSLISKYGYDINLGSVPKIKTKLKFGTHYVADLLLFYFLKYIPDLVDSFYEEYPKEILQLINNMSLDFYERLNPGVIPLIPKEYLKLYLSKLSDAEIYPYCENDWDELFEIGNFLCKYYPNILN